MSPETLRSFFGWCAVGNLLFVSVWFFLFLGLHESLYRLHHRWFEISRPAFDTIHYAGMAGYKIATWLLCIIPYLALRLLA